MVRGTISVFPVFLFINFAYASHTRASSGRFWTYLLTHSRLSAVHVAGFLYTLAGESEEQKWHSVELL